VLNLPLVKTNSHILLAATRKAIIIVLMGCFTVGAFATLGDGKSNKSKPRKLLSTKSPYTPGSFTLRSGYTYRGQQVIRPVENSYIDLTTVVTYQQGHTTYTIPLKKKVVLNNKVTFNPNAATRNR
jgi:hypothetical protein